MLLHSYSIRNLILLNLYLHKCLLTLLSQNEVILLLGLYHLRSQMQFLNLKLLIYCLDLKLRQDWLLRWESSLILKLLLLTTIGHLRWLHLRRLLLSNLWHNRRLNTCMRQLRLRNWLSSCFRVMSVYVVLKHEVVRILLFKIFSDFRKNLTNAFQHVLAHVFDSVLLENLSGHLLLLILHSMYKMAKVASLTPNRSMIILAWHRPIISNLNLHFFIFPMFFIHLFLISSLLLLGITFLKCFDLSFNFRQILRYFEFQ